MKKLLFAFMLLPMLSIGQLYNDLGCSIGFGSSLTMGLQYKSYEVQAIRILSTKASLPFVIVNANVHYGIFYGGYGSEGVSAGVRYQGKKNYTIQAGISGQYGMIALGVTSLPKKPAGGWLNTNDKWLVGLQLLSGFASGMHESIQAGHWGTGNFWDNSVSWKNKYKADGVTERFPGSKGVFVFTTDGYHLTNFVQHAADIATLTVALNSKDNNWKTITKKVLLSVIANRAAFYLSYNQIFK